MTEEAGPTSEQEHRATGLGAALRAARLDQGMGVRDVAEALNLNERTVEALEAEDWAALPPGPFTTGYARSCAHLLGVDRGFVDSCLGTGAPTREREAPLRPQMTAPTGRSGAGGRLIVVGLLLFVLLAAGSAAGWWWLDQQGTLSGGPGAGDTTEPDGAQDDNPAGIDQTPATDDGAGDPEAPEQDPENGNGDTAAPDSAVDAGDGAQEGGGDAVLAEPDLDSPPGALSQDLSPPDDSESGDSVASAEADDADREPAGDDTQAVENTTAPASDATEADDLPDLERPSPQPRSDGLTGTAQDSGQPDGEPDGAPRGEDQASGAGEDEPDDAGEQGEIAVELNGPSWVEITDGDGERLLYGLIRDEGRRTLTGELPFSVVIGDVTQVDVFYDGDPVDLGTDDPGRVARVEVP